MGFNDTGMLSGFDMTSISNIMIKYPTNNPTQPEIILFLFIVVRFI